ncbi:MAG: hypothetical protein ABMA64_23290 [Myxococcota bacterium]
MWRMAPLTLLAGCFFVTEAEIAAHDARFAATGMWVGQCASGGGAIEWRLDLVQDGQELYGAGALGLEEVTVEGTLDRGSVDLEVTRWLGDVPLAYDTWHGALRGDALVGEYFTDGAELECTAAR